MTITQRGKPDVVISGTVLSSCRAEEPAAEYFAGKPETLFPADTINQLRQMEEAVKSVLPSRILSKRCVKRRLSLRLR